MQSRTRQLSIVSDPWLAESGEALSPLDRQLLDAVVAGDLLGVQRYLLQGADSLCAIKRAVSGEYRTIVGLCTWHESEVAKALLETFSALEYPERQRFMLAVLGSTGRPLPQDLLIWFLRREAGRFPKFDRGHYWRFLASRACWDVMRECHDMLWDWENIHAGSNAYTAAFVWVRAVLSNEPPAELIKKWMTEVLVRYDVAGYFPERVLIDELAMQMALEVEQMPPDRVIEDLSHLVLPSGGMRSMFLVMQQEHAMKSILRSAIALADLRMANACAAALMEATPVAEEVVRRGRL